MSYNQSVAALYRAMGIGLEMNRIELDIIDHREQEELAKAAQSPDATPAADDAPSGQGF